MGESGIRVIATKKPALPRLLLESFAIFASVLLAFLVEQWRDNINAASDANAALNLVRAELQQNLTELETAIPTRPTLLATYQEALGTFLEENRFPQDLPKFETPTVTSLAYQLATDSGAVTTVEPADLLVIARAYESLESIRRNELFLVERNAQIRFNDGEQYLSGFIFYINQASGNEPTAVRDIKLAIDRLDERLQ